MFPILGLVTGVVPVLSLTSASASDTAFFPNNASATLGLSSDGSYVGRAEQWMNSDFRALGAFDPTKWEGGYFGVTGDSPSGSALNTYITLDNSPSWSLTVAGLGSLFCTGTMKVREVANPANEVTASASISAEVFGGGGEP